MARRRTAGKTLLAASAATLAYVRPAIVSLTLPQAAAVGMSRWGLPGALALSQCVCSPCAGGEALLYVAGAGGTDAWVWSVTATWQTDDGQLGACAADLTTGVLATADATLPASLFPCRVGPDDITGFAALGPPLPAGAIRCTMQLVWSSSLDDRNRQTLCAIAQRPC